jgi:hypothetical protein
MSGDGKGLDGQEQRLDHQDHGVHQGDRVDHAEGDPLDKAEILRDEREQRAGDPEHVPVRARRRFRRDP